jgi:hypothetical protein
VKFTFVYVVVLNRIGTGSRIRWFNVTLCDVRRTFDHDHVEVLLFVFLRFFLFLGATAQGELWSTEQSASILLYPRLTGF